jgi:hypothetical protein
VSDAVTLELEGVPTIMIGHTTFEGAARVHAKARGLPELPMLIHEPPGAGVVGDTIDVSDESMELVVGALTGDIQR